MLTRITLVRSIIPFTFVLALGCESSATAPDAGEFAPQAARVGGPELTGAERALAQQVVAATARFHSLKQAEMAGYAQASVCVAMPGMGAMGYHFVNQLLVDPVFDARQPEALLYAPDSDGELKLVGVEYIVIDAGQAAPTFASRAFDVGGTPVPVPHWSLHAWLWQANPNGTFTPFNPTVSCN